MNLKTLLFGAGLVLLVINGMNGLFAQSVWRPFGDDSPWNRKIPSDAKTDSSLTGSLLILQKEIFL